MILKPTNKIITTLLVIFVSVNLMGCGAVTPVPTAIITSTPEPSPMATIPAVPTISVNAQSALAMSNECRAVVDGLYNLKKDLGLPDHFTHLEEIPFRLDSEFNPNSYFSVLTHLKLTSGFKLDYIYFTEEFGGFPLVYARKSSSAPFQSYADLLKSFGEEFEGERSWELRHKYDYLEQIHIDKTPESYFEFRILAILGDQFYLWWHGSYNDAMILCDPSDMQYVDAEIKDLNEFSQDVRDRIEKIDFSPVVIVSESDVTVRFVTFTKWGGFFEYVYVMDKEDPMQLLDVQINPLIEYDCGLSF